MKKYCRSNAIIKGFRWNGENVQDFENLFFPKTVPLYHVANKFIRLVINGKEESLPPGTYFILDESGSLKALDWITFMQLYYEAVPAK